MVGLGSSHYRYHHHWTSASVARHGCMKAYRVPVWMTALLIEFYQLNAAAAAGHYQALTALYHGCFLYSNNGLAPYSSWILRRSKMNAV
jgi:hypothetical protein